MTEAELEPLVHATRSRFAFVFIIALAILIAVGGGLYLFDPGMPWVLRLGLGIPALLLVFVLGLFAWPTTDRVIRMLRDRPADVIWGGRAFVARASIRPRPISASATRPARCISSRCAREIRQRSSKACSARSLTPRSVTHPS